MSVKNGQIKTQHYTVGKKVTRPDLSRFQKCGSARHLKGDP